MNRLLRKMIVLGLFLVTAEVFHIFSSFFKIIFFDIVLVPWLWWMNIVIALPALIIIGAILMLVSFLSDWVIKGKLQLLWSCLLYYHITICLTLVPNGINNDKIVDILYFGFFGVIYGLVSEFVNRKVMSKKDLVIEVREA